MNSEHDLGFAQPEGQSADDGKKTPRRPRGILALVWRWLLIAVILVAPLLAFYLASPSAGPVSFREGYLLDGEGPLAFSSDGTTLATGHISRSVRLWNIATGELVGSLNNRGEFHRLAFSPDGTLAIADEGGVRFWDSRTSERQVIKGRRVYVVAFSPDGKTLACGGKGGESGFIGLYDVQAGRFRQTLREDHEAEEPAESEIQAEMGKVIEHDFIWSFVHKLAFSRDGRLLASCHDGHRYIAIKVWEVRTGKLLHDLGCPGASVRGLAFLPDSKTLVATSGKKLLFWDIGPRLRFWEVRTKPSHERELPDWPAGLAISPDGRTMATACREKEGWLWHTTTGESLQALAAPKSRTPGVAFSPDGKRFANVESRGVRLWDVVLARHRR